MEPIHTRTDPEGCTHCWGQNLPCDEREQLEQAKYKYHGGLLAAGYVRQLVQQCKTPPMPSDVLSVLILCFRSFVDCKGVWRGGTIRVDLYVTESELVKSLQKVEADMESLQKQLELKRSEHAKIKNKLQATRSQPIKLKM